MLDLYFAVFSKQSKSIEYCFRDEQFDDGTPDDACESDDDALYVMMSRQGNKVKSSPSILHNKDLEDKDEQYDYDEEIIVEHLSKHVKLIPFKFTSIEEVKDL